MRLKLGVLMIKKKIDQRRSNPPLLIVFESFSNVSPMSIDIPIFWTRKVDL